MQDEGWDTRLVGGGGGGGEGAVEGLTGVSGARGSCMGLSGVFERPDEGIGSVWD